MKHPPARRRALLALALTVALAILTALVPRVASAADPDCVVHDERGSYRTCFDPGNRLRLGASTAGVGGGIDLRHRVQTDDPRIHYRLEHGLLDGTLGRTRYDATLYTLRFVRHSENGYLVIPTNPPRQLALPFDLGLEASALHVEGLRHDALLQVGVVRIALLADFARSSDGRFRLAVGPAMRWDATVDRAARTAVENDVAPFTLAALSAYAESKDGLTLARLSLEGGWERFGEQGSRRVAHGEVAVERVLLAVNDRPLSVFLSGRYDDPGRGFVGDAGIRFALFGRAR